MITIFSSFKSWDGHFGVIQRNAIRSWKRLLPEVEIIIYDDAPGTAEMVQEVGAVHVPEVKRNSHGTPVLNFMFSHTAEIAKNDIICYVNGDMVFFDDLLRAVQQIKATGISEFLAVGHRYDVDITTEIGFSASWQEEIRKQALEKGERHNDYGIDYFMLPRHLFAKMQMPDFPIGRACWDNWFIYRVRALGVPVISLSNAIVAVHQNHDYSHHPKGRKGVHEGVEVEENLNVAGGRDHLFFLCDVTHELFPGGLQKARPELCTFSRKLRNYGTLHPLSGAPLRLLRKIVLGIKNLLRGTSNES